MEHETYSYIEEANIYQCIFCGAYADSIELIEHYETCTRAQGIEQYDGMFD